jgi:transcription elongation factor Elf1
MNNVVKGKNTCWMCGHEFAWNAPLIKGKGTPIWDTLSSVVATNSGVSNGKLDHLILEVTATCPQCGLSNRFQHRHELE